MKTVLLNADGDVSAYEVPNIVANNLMKYCSEFNKWLWNSVQAKRFHTKHGVCYNEKDFIEYLNVWIFPEEQSRVIETVGTFEFIASKQPLPDKYRDCEWFNF